MTGTCEKRGLLGHGAGHVVWHCATTWGCAAPEAARRLAAGEGWELAALDDLPSPAVVNTRSCCH